MNFLLLNENEIPTLAFHITYIMFTLYVLSFLLGYFFIKLSHL